MNDLPATVPELPWHRALIFALLGRDLPDLGRQSRPDPGHLVTELELVFPGGRAGLIEAITVARQEPTAPWPRPVPDELRAGLGAAQLAAALIDVRRLLGIEAGQRRTRAERGLDAAEQALQREVPPHW